MDRAGCEIVRRYNEAWLARDLPAMDAFLGDDLVLWHNHIGRTFSKAAMMGFVADALDVLVKVEFRDAVRTATSAGCVQQHRLFCQLADGGIVDAPQAIVYIVRDGRIRRIDEYTDGPALAATGIDG
jgi:ketosteroid isomerase-like protein